MNNRLQKTKNHIPTSDKDTIKRERLSNIRGRNDRGKRQSKVASSRPVPKLFSEQRSTVNSSSTLVVVHWIRISWNSKCMVATHVNISLHSHGHANSSTNMRVNTYSSFYFCTYYWLAHDTVIVIHYIISYCGWVVYLIKCYLSYSAANK